jgi:hypothetical protein
VLESHGKTTFNNDGSMISETDSLMTIKIPEGNLPVAYSAVVHGKWSVGDQMLRTSRTSEEVTAKNEISRKFIDAQEMTKLRSESETDFVYRIKRISPRKIVTLDSDGSQTIYTRKK